MRSDGSETGFDDPGTIDGSERPDDAESPGDDPGRSGGGDDPGWLTDGRRRQLRLTGRIGLTLLVVAVVVPFVVFAVPQLAGADYSFVVLSGSMEPAISPGDVVVVADDDPSAVEEGDVITYRRSSEETPTTHRVVGVEGTDDDRQFRTKGDANDDPDGSPVAADQYVGRVTLTIPFIGHVITFVDTPLGFALLVVAPIVAFVLSEAWALRSGSGTDDAGTTGPERGLAGTSGADGRGAGRSALRPGDATFPSADRDAPSGPRGRGDEGEPVGPVVRSPETAGGEAADETGGSAGYRITGADLTMSSVVLLVLACYSGWIVYGSFARTGAPDVLSVVVCTASASSLVLALAVRSRFVGESVEPDPDGGRTPRPLPGVVHDGPAPGVPDRGRSSEFVWYDSPESGEFGSRGRRTPDRSERRSNGAGGGPHDAEGGDPGDR